MAMTRLELLTAACKIIGDVNLVSEATTWLNNILYEIESVGFWKFLETETTYQTENNVASVAFSASKWPSAAISDYSKGLAIYSAEPRQLIQLSKSAYDASNDGTTGNPFFFSLWKSTVYLYPIPVTGSIPLLTVQYFQEITVPTADGDDMETTTGIKPKYFKYLIDGIIAEGMSYVDDERWEKFSTRFEKKLFLMLRDNEDFFTFRESRLDKPSTVRMLQQSPTGG